MDCPNCKSEMLSEECTFKLRSGNLADAKAYYCEECGCSFEVRRGHRYELFGGVSGVDDEMLKNIEVHDGL